MGYEGYLINEDLNNQYIPATTATGNYYQENYLTSTGYNGKISFNIAAEYDKKYYFGVNLNAHFNDYIRTTSFYEDYYDGINNNETTGVQALRFENNLHTYGAGFSFQIGAITKITPELRLGLSYESPTWYRFDEELTQNLTVDCADCPGRPSVFDVTPNVTMVYAPYKLQTPGKFTGSMAYFFGDKGLVSIDYTRKDYSNMRFKPKNEFPTTNTNIDALLTATNEIRIGGEYNLKNWSFRAGYRFEDSPYKNSKTMGNLNSYSGGLGYNFGEIKADISYTFAKRNYEMAFFSQGFTDTATINNKNNNVSLTILFEL